MDQPSKVKGKAMGTAGLGGEIWKIWSSVLNIINLRRFSDIEMEMLRR